MAAFLARGFCEYDTPKAKEARMMYSVWDSTFMWISIICGAAAGVLLLIVKIDDAIKARRNGKKNKNIE